MSKKEVLELLLDLLESIKYKDGYVDEDLRDEIVKRLSVLHENEVVKGEK